MIKQALIGTNIITTGVCSKRIDPRSLTAGFESQFIILKFIGVDLGGQPERVPSLFEKRPSIYRILPHSP